jgi:hypothetical protein
MVHKWAREDRAAMGPDAIIPAWNVKTPGVFGMSIRLVISVPPVRASQTFGATVFPASVSFFSIPDEPAHESARAVCQCTR